jgi:phosphonoacetaldehyde hydrolase
MRSKYTGPLRAVVFDWAGTVLDYGSRAPVLAVMRTFADHGVPVTTEEARGPMGMAKRDHIMALFALPRVRDAWAGVHGEPPGEGDVEQLYKSFIGTQQSFLVENAGLIPGCLDTIAACRDRGLALGSSTGYTAALMELIVPAARRQGLVFDAVLCADDVPQGRPAPWMCLENAKRLGVYPMEAIVVVDDTPVGVAAGLNAGMWTVGVVKSGNSVGLTEAEFQALSLEEQQSRLQAGRQQLLAAGAHLVVDTVAELPAALDQIELHLAQGLTP